MGTQNTLAASVQPKKGRLYAVIQVKENGKAKMSAQAIGGAVGHNPISIIIPCHRVVGANGNLTGYAGGIKKIQLKGMKFMKKSNSFLKKNMQTNVRKSIDKKNK